uniref:Dynein axonemal assembly factor 11-like CS domain-containing protein n=1 Tax=Globisporangium ultimum (strain ATCC 200006 / CBS 805.95 / DAOM BR144) TaxID=431595 RepID=K3XAH3_GLOUD
MPRITVELLRKRSEHNEGIISTLEEISLHQEELERIEVIGTLCRKLRILYLQNNIIEKIEDLTHMKELRYLNLALNNVSKIEGLAACEFLNKLDLTVNFIDFDALEESIHLRELYMLGNPCQSNWPDGFPEYVVASLPQLQSLDGKDIHKSDRIKALQVFSERQRYVREQADHVRAEKLKKAEADEQNNQAEAGTSTPENEADVIEVISNGATDISKPDDPRDEKPQKKSVFKSNEKVPYTPHTRREMYMELAEQKEEEEARKRENQPKDRNTESEHAAALRKVRQQEQRDDDDAIRQCNEGKWEFRIVDEVFDVILEVDLPRFLDTSLVDVDVHPSYVSIVAKNKLLRLRFPELVHSDAGKAERSKVTGTLRLTLPKAHISETQKLRAQLKREEFARETNKVGKARRDKMKGDGADATVNPQRTRAFANQRIALSDEILDAANSEKKNPSTTRINAVNIRGLVPKAGSNQDDESESSLSSSQLKVIATK